MGVLLNRIEFFFTFDTSHKFTSQKSDDNSNSTYSRLDLIHWNNSRNWTHPQLASCNFLTDKKSIFLAWNCIRTQLIYYSINRRLYLFVDLLFVDLQLIAFLHHLKAHTMENDIPVRISFECVNSLEWRSFILNSNTLVQIFSTDLAEAEKAPP